MNKRILAATMIGTALAASLSAPALATDFRVTLPATGIDASNDGRIILVITPDGSKEPRFQVKLGADAPQVFGINVDGLKPGGSAQHRPRRARLSGRRSLQGTCRRLHGAGRPPQISDL